MHLAADDLAFAYPGRPVLGHVTVRVAAGDRLAVVGENGTGKSTLLHVLAGLLTPSEGELRIDGTIALVEQEFVPAPGHTVGDLVAASLAGVRAVAAELDRVAAAFDHDGGSLAALADVLVRADHAAAWDVDRRLDVALTRLGACRDAARELDTLSVGERFRVRLACRLAERPDLLLLDEPTNHLDDTGIDHLTAEMTSWRGGVVVVTHDRQLLDDVATAVLDLDPAMDGRPVLYGQPGYLAYRFAKNQALHRWRQRYRAERQRAEKLAERLDASYEGLSDEWRPPKGSQRHRRATGARIHVKAADRLIEGLKAQAVEIPVPPLRLQFPDLPAMAPEWEPTESLVELIGPRVGPPDAARLDLPGVRIAIPPSGRLLVTGPNGSGKSTLLLALTTGVVDRGLHRARPGVRIGVIAQEGIAPVAEGQNGFDVAVATALDLLAAGLLDPELVLPVACLGLLDEADLERPLAELSAGQRRRFDLALALVAVPHLLVLDEPTNHLSIDLVDELTQALRLTPAAVVIATHDRRMREDFADWPCLDLA